MEVSNESSVMSNEAYQKAEEKIEAVLRSQTRELYLSGGGSDSNLTTLPPSLERLTQLEVLTVSHAQLQSLPNVIAQLTNLQKLDVSFNQIKSLPDWIGGLTELRILDLSSNNLESLPFSLAHLTKLEVLDLSSNQLVDLPESVRKLKSLISLDTSRNPLTTLPSWIGELKKLQSLFVIGPHLMTLPESMRHLTRLTTLHLVNIGLVRLPWYLAELGELRTLNLTGNRITKLPEWVDQWRKLQSLQLYNNKLKTLPETLGNLENLTWLYVANNELMTLPESVGQLVSLENLDVEENQVQFLPDSIGQLTNLRRLDLSYNDLRSLPESLTKLTELRELFLQENPRLNLPEDILGPDFDDAGSVMDAADPRAILAFYFAQQQRGAKPLNEVKLLLVGHGRVGKTSLSKALRGVSHDELEPETPGIERHTLKLRAVKSPITAHIWDFGGQEFLHQTHQFFFSQRSMYVVVLSGRDRQPMPEAQYWLRLIRTYGTGSPVVIVLNKIKEHPFTIDEFFLRENYPEVKAVVKTDCRPRFGVEALRKALGKLAGEMPSVREKIVPAWARVRLRLEEMDTSFVSFVEYREICSQEGVTTSENQETLATILDCLGIALNYRDDPRLRDTSVLKPRWLVDGIYTILRWLQNHKTNGQMSLADFPKALKSRKEYPPHMHRFLLALMGKFELCFPLNNEEKSYLVPGLLDENQPRELKKFVGKNAQRIQLRYDDVRPLGLLPRFIVRSHTLSERRPRWRRGVVLSRRSAQALVRGDHEGRVTDIFVIGDSADDRVWITEFILSEMRVLNEKLPVRTYVEDETGAWTELEILRDAVKRDEITRAERKADGSTVMVNVMERLREVESPEASTPRDNTLSLFICYARANERIVKRLIPSLKVLARRGYISPWRDTDLIPGDDWDETIQERLSESQIILFMVSRDFLASRYITEHERPVAMRLMNEKKAIVVPVLLSKCSWQDEDFSKLEKLPRKDELISSINPREEAWALVEEGLKKVVEKFRTSLPVLRQTLSRLAKH
jgi:internalin A